MQNQPTKVNGDSVSADEFNQPNDELESIITSSGQTLSGADLTQAAKAIANYVGSVNYYLDTGAANAYVVNVTGTFKAPTIYNNGMEIRFRAANANTGAATVNVSSLGIKNIKKADGSTDLAAGDISTTHDTILRYNGTSFVLVSLGALAVNNLTAINANITGTTDASSSTTGSLKTAGGLGVAKKLYVGTDLDVGGTSNLNRPAFFAQRSGNQTVTAGVSSIIAINNEILDTDARFNPATTYDFTTNKLGWYVIGAEVACFSDNASATFDIAILKNGIVIASTTNIPNSIPSNAKKIHVQTLIGLNGTTDYIQLSGLISAGTTCYFQADTTFFYAYKISI